MTQTAPDQLDLSIVIVSWNVADLLADCLDSIFDNAIVQSQSADERIRYEVIVVDSASSDQTVDLLQNQYPRVTLLAQVENVGFTRGNNIGMDAAKGRHILLLNPDTLVLGDALAEMVRYLDDNPDVGIIGPHTLNTDGTVQSTRRRFPSVKLAYYESTWLQPYAPKDLLDAYYMNDTPAMATIDVDWVQGSALMMRREVYDEIGGMDEGFVMYSEELDLCHRAKDAGWRVVFLATAQIIHHGGKSSEQASARKHILFQQSKIRYFRKYYGDRVARRLRRFLMLNYLWQLGIESIKWLLGHKRHLRRDRISAYWQVLRSGFQVS